MGPEGRRSTRIERPVPLLHHGTRRAGGRISERTSARKFESARLQISIATRYARGSLDYVANWRSAAGEVVAGRCAAACRLHVVTNFAQRRFANLQRNPRTHVAYRVAMDICSRADSNLPPMFAPEIPAPARRVRDEQRHRTLDARAASSFRSMNTNVVSAAGMMLTRGLRANGEIKSNRGIVGHQAGWKAHG